MGKLADLAKAMSPFLKVLPGEDVTALYKGFKVVPNSKDPEKEVFRYLLEVDGQKKSWDNAKMAIAMILDRANEGDIIKIKNSGTKDEPNYSVEIMVGVNAGQTPEVPGKSKK